MHRDLYDLVSQIQIRILPKERTLSNEVMVNHFCIELLSISILEIYQYWSLLLVCP